MFKTCGTLSNMFNNQVAGAVHPGWRPRYMWLPMGALLGAIAGGLTGATLMLVTSLVDPDATTSGNGSAIDAVGAVAPLLVIGLVFGAAAGIGVGLVVGLEMVFLVGAHLSREVARHRAYILGFVLPPVTMLTPALLASDSSMHLTWSEGLWWAITIGGASLLGGPMARRVAGTGHRHER